MRVLAALSEKVSPRDVLCRDASLFSVVSFSFARAEIEKQTRRFYLLEKILSYLFPPTTKKKPSMLISQRQDAIQTSPLI